MTERIRILVTGSRTWTNEEMLYDTLERVRRQHPDLSRWTIVHGGCPEGADELADRWARDHGVTTEVHPAQWRVDGKVNKQAGFIRNSEMVQSGVDMCLAFVNRCRRANCSRRDRHATHGAAHCASEASKAGVPVFTIRDRWEGLT